MDKERFKKVRALFAEAAALPISEQAAFLRLACAGDLDLEADVANLLGAHVQRPDFLAEPVLKRASPPEQPPTPSLERELPPERSVETKPASQRDSVIRTVLERRPRQTPRPAVVTKPIPRRHPHDRGGLFQRHGWKIAGLLLSAAMLSWSAVGLLYVQQQRQSLRAALERLDSLRSQSAPSLSQAQLREQLTSYRNDAEQVVPKLWGKQFADRMEEKRYAASAAQYLTQIAPMAARDPKTAEQLFQAFLDTAQLDWSDTSPSLGDPAAAGEVCQHALQLLAHLPRSGKGVVATPAANALRAYAGALPAGASNQGFANH